MSKIQDALDKIKASKQEAVDFSAHSINTSAPGQQPGVGLSVTESISRIQDMKQPEEMPSAQKAKNKIIDNLMADRKAFNAFRDFRTTVLQRVHNTSPIIMVTSCIPGGGGSFVALNLATAIAMDETKTSMLIDCNMHDDSYTDLILSDVKTGLKDYLRGDNCTIGDIIHPTGIPRMRAIPTGLLNIPMAEHFTSARLRQLFDDVKSRYDHRYIIVDAPPIAENADARILAQVCDYVVLVVPYGKITEDKVIATARAVGKDKLLGVVFNNQPRTPRFSW